MNMPNAEIIKCQKMEGGGGFDGGQRWHIQLKGDWSKKREHFNNHQKSEEEMALQ
jgi:hypothetical protein